MMPGNATLQFYQGGSKTVLITWKSSTGAVRDLTGCTFRCIGKKAYSDTTTTFSLTSANGGATLITDAGVQKIRLAWTDEAVAGIPFGDGVWDLFIDFANGDAQPLLAGIYRCSRRVVAPNV